MGQPDSPRPVRGAADLAALWRGLPVRALGFPAAALPTEEGLAGLGNRLRALAWRELCAAPTPGSCVDAGRGCRHADQGRCRADVLFPLAVGGGAASWRMATLFLQWRPSLEQLRLLALGDVACDLLGWAARGLRDAFGLEQAEILPISSLADIELRRASRWRLSFVTPWLVHKQRWTASLASPDGSSVAFELAKAMRIRGHKLSALCATEPTWQRLAGHLAHHVADALLPGALDVEQVAIEGAPMRLRSSGNGAEFDSLSWSGFVTLRVEEAVLPWLTLLAVCGGGENADKGFGGVELMPLD